VRERFAKHIAQSVSKHDAKASATASRWLASLNGPNTQAPSSPPIMLLAERGSKFRLSGHNLVVNSGTMFTKLAAGASIVSHGWVLTAPKHDVLLAVEYKGKAFRVKVCGEKPVTLSQGLTKTELLSGQEATCVRQKPTEMQVLPHDKIGRRKMIAQALDYHSTVVLSEFSIPSMLGSYTFLQPIKAAHTQFDQAVQSEVFKTAVSLGMVTVAHGQFSSRK
jgi:hypothetical protein